MRAWIGTSGFQYKAWRGGFYPEGLAESKMLPYYAERFTSTESNYSFRCIPSASTIEKWAAATPENFRFSFKAPQKVTHFAKLRDCGETMLALERVLQRAEKKLGVVLLQLPPTFKKDAVLLGEFLGELQGGLRVAFEFRHPSWFDQETYGVLEQRGAALCIAEDEDLAAPRVSTAKFGYLRLRREDYKPAEIKEWAKFAASQAGAWEETFIYFKHEDSGVGPKFAAQMMESLQGAG